MRNLVGFIALLFFSSDVLADGLLPGTGFPITLGTTVITGNSTTPSVTGLSIAAGGSNTLAATSFAGNGCTIGTDNLCVNGTVAISGAVRAPVLTLNGNGAVSNSPFLMTGTVLTGGSATTNFPADFIQPTGTTAVTTWSTSGTGLGMNLASGFAGNFLDFHAGGAGSVYSVASNGATTQQGSSTIGNSAVYGWLTRSLIGSPADGVIRLTNNAVTGFTRLDLGGTTSSFGSLQTNGTETVSELADGSGLAPFGMSRIEVGATGATASTGEIAMAKETASGTAPGAGFLKFGVVAGTNAGTCKIIAYAGTSATPVTIADNVGSGC